MPALPLCPTKCAPFVSVDAEHDGLTVDVELLLAIAQRGLGNLRKAVGAVMAIPGYEPHGAAVALDAQAITIVLDLVEPVGAVRHGLGSGWQAELEDAGRENAIVTGPRICESRAVF
ncbi:hypothetical protein GCM10010987_72240 [Bradyrhizobium guangdongense]|uniref:Uncharacterized protein n=1 Tax=Bradyrhizobium guangdongense TaxID=1325090 RepID=A0AA87WC93_9BRAD|nr:hypothetical protein GCM10010987_72240 [Bradyrhizobium guangdongense]